MSRRFLLPILLVMLIASATAPFVFTAQASSGCGAIGGLSGFYSEKQSKSTGSITFSAGDSISVKVTQPGNDGSTAVRLSITGNDTFDQSSSGGISYKIPSNGQYTVTITNISLEDLNFVTAKCGDGPVNQPWGGFTDGRLNPEMAENYSLWCLRNNLDIYRAPNGVGELIISIPLTQIFAIKEGKANVFATKTGPIIIERLNKNVVFVKGNNGTNAPAFTAKFFTITECIIANGGEPPKSTQIPRPTSTLTPTLTPTPIPLTPTATPVIEDSYLVGNLVALLNALGSSSDKIDTDGDGIRDKFDLCPDVTAPGLAFGCPDDDGDTVSNPVDLCPNVAGLASMQGCPDIDGDGVSSRFDMCPDRAPTAGTPTALGCPDPDGDGVPNGRYPNSLQLMDWCPMNGGLPGVPMFMGCPDPDSDGLLSSDFPGVPGNYIDDCPRYPYVWNTADGACPDTTNLAPITPSVDNVQVQALFMYAQQLGSFDGLYVPTTQQQIQICTATTYLFCGW
jgi:hypothetical protein